ncbi:MAG: sulfite exporter TauE/SafE family protein [Acidimicrobiia bacterium]|nr:sulfite exporter TauE/SafE family protein [Acidimicrobiia bacterium]
MGLTAAQLAIAVVAVFAGATVQGSIGFGMNLVAVPVVALIDPTALPATLVLAGLPVSTLMVRREHHAIDRPGVGWILVGRLPGTVLGAWAVTVASRGALSVLLGASVLVAVAMTSLGRPVPITATTSTAAGFASGTMGTAAAIGGPPLALLYQHRDGETMRSTLAASFLLGTALSITMLAITGALTWRHVRLALALTPGIAAGVALSTRLAATIDATWLRPAVLAFAGLTGVVAILNGLL